MTKQIKLKKEKDYQISEDNDTNTAEGKNDNMCVMVGERIETICPSCSLPEGALTTGIG